VIGRLAALRLPALLALATAGVASAAPLPEQGYGLPRDVSVDGHRIDGLIHFTTIATSAIFVLAGAMLLVALVRHRRRHRADYNPGNRGSIGLVVGFVALVALAVDGYLFTHTIIDVERFFWNFASAEEHPETTRIQVQAHQWSWAARYAGADGKFNTADDVLTMNDIRVPLGTPVLIQLASVDVIHSFNLPNFRVKRDAVPGEITKLTFQAREEGEFVISCAQHCGPNHYKMRGVLTVLAKDRYEEWLRVAGAHAQAAYDPEDEEAHWGWEWRAE
jgi:cytochrome c oxidase subunit II